MGGARSGIRFGQRLTRCHRRLARSGSDGWLDYERRVRAIVTADFDPLTFDDDFLYDHRLGCAGPPAQENSDTKRNQGRYDPCCALSRFMVFQSICRISATTVPIAKSARPE